MHQFSRRPRRQPRSMARSGRSVNDATPSPSTSAGVNPAPRRASPIASAIKPAVLHDASGCRSAGVSPPLTMPGRGSPLIPCPRAAARASAAR
ncbi:hypothetical protein G6F59_018584 [Rhizopus arrhizus]|nr:hypothetical protein G6F59_018584 [Rhizopus arrhizus]